MSKIQQQAGCWAWLGSLDQDGYAVFWLDGRQQRAARVAWRFLCGPLANDLEIDHVRANGCTSRACVKAIADEHGPAHLEPVTGRVNTLRGDAVSALNARKTHCKRGHPFDTANTLVNKRGHRSCRACNRDHARRRLGILPENYRVAWERPRCAVCGTTCSRRESIYCGNSCRGKAGAAARWGK